MQKWSQQHSMPHTCQQTLPRGEHDPPRGSASRCWTPTVHARDIRLHGLCRCKGPAAADLRRAAAPSAKKYLVCGGCGGTQGAATQQATTTILRNGWRMQCTKTSWWKQQERVKTARCNAAAGYISCSMSGAQLAGQPAAACYLLRQGIQAAAAAIDMIDQAAQCLDHTCAEYTRHCSMLHNTKPPAPCMHSHVNVRVLKMLGGCSHTRHTHHPNVCVAKCGLGVTCSHGML